jgi:hypothetical protein
MVMFVVLGVVLVLAIGVIGGLFFLMKKEAEKEPDNAAVPIKDIAELRKQITVNEKPIVSAGLAADELSEAKAKLAALEQDTPAVDAPPAGEIKFSKILVDDEFPASPAVVAPQASPQLEERVRELELEVEAITQKAIRQAEDAVKLIETLTQENEALKAGGQSGSTVNAASGDLDKMILELREKNNILDNQLDLGSSKIEQLETQLAVIRKEMGQQLIEANSTIARLKAEEEAQGRVSQESLLSEKKETDEWREKTALQMREMEDTLAKTREENLLLKDAKKLLEAKLSVVEDDFKKQLEDAKSIVQSLTGEKEATQQRTVDLEQNVEKLKELNATLIDKAKILQFELNRQRAQATGMERVCANFKTQLEELFNTVEKTKKDNERLLQERANIENGVASLKSENTRLSQKDKEYQLELQKTKEQMHRFEKLYDNFKTNLKDVAKPKDQ